MGANNTINGRTPEEIKKGLKCCMPFDEERCCDCPYCHGEEACYTQKNNDVLALIQRLKDERDELLQESQRLERERDAAVKDIRNAAWCCCHVCKHYYQPNPNVRIYSCKKYGDFDKHDFIADDGSIFCGAMEWRGVQEVE